MNFSYDFCPNHLIRLVANIKRKFSKIFKTILLRNHKGDEADNWHTILGN